MQIHDDQTDRLSNASDISKASSALETSSLKDDEDDVTQTSALQNESGGDVTQQPEIEEGIPIEGTPEVAQEAAGTEGVEGQGEEDDLKESDV